ncbi:sulfatase-like hydrolase/transferase [Erysipelothrix urinaevulpis]|uniref:sulfatase-like hydrolase/transferase n=1 Tax=Erysipelothrix urinaevulpis TaxID=2683717 RepID=UPI0013598FE2|nr:sulfatase-like hydrolase/transferase [Erysipelothrix urinaevulpis]
MKQPNIIFILADDLGPWALGTSGNEDIITPNIDQLAEEGIKFDDFFCASPVCSPARASLMTGKIPSQHGVHDWVQDGEGLEEIEYLEGQVAYTDILTQHGYRCGLSGKWHLGKSSKVQKSFDHFFAHKSGSGPYYNAPFYRNGKFEIAEGYVTDVITDDAIHFINETHTMDKPFYLSVAYTAPHSPWINNHPQEYLDLYKDCAFKSIPDDQRHPDAIYLTDMVEEDLHGNLSGYFAATTAMDTNIGKIIDTLNDLGIKKDTLIIFSSDNGFSCGQHGYWGKGNGTYPINMYDESVKVPFIVSHEGYTPKGLVSKELLSAYDFFPTILDYVGIDYELDNSYPGKSFASSLRTGSSTKRDYVFDEYGPNRMIRSEDYKYIKRYPVGPDELYNLNEDPKEYNNLIKEYKDMYHEVANVLRFDLERWFFKYVNPEIDGAKEAVYGSGQVNKAGLWSKGKVSHADADFVIREEHKSQ